MSKPVGLYLPLLQSYKNYKRNSTDVESVNFWERTKRVNRTHELAFYDKISQYMDSDIELPPESENNNLLRYELRLNKRISKQLGVSSVMAKMLFEQQMFDIIGNRWMSDYEEILKAESKVFSFNLENITTPMVGVEAMAAMYVARHNAEYRADLRFLKENKVFLDPKYYSRLKAKLERNNYLDYHKGEGLVAELDQKVLEAFETYRQ